MSQTYALRVLDNRQVEIRLLDLPEKTDLIAKKQKPDSTAFALRSARGIYPYLELSVLQKLPNHSRQNTEELLPATANML